MVWVLFAKIEEFDLFWMGVLHLGSAFIGFVGFTAVTVKLGWFDAYWEGLTKSIALKVGKFSPMIGLSLKIHYLMDSLHHLFFQEQISSKIRRKNGTASFHWGTF